MNATQQSSRLATEPDQRGQEETGRLQQPEELLRLFVKHVPAAVAMLDRDMRYLQVSDRWCADYSLDCSQVMGRSHDEIFPDFPERWKQEFGRCLAGETVSAREERWDHRDGSTCWLRWELRPWGDRNGLPEGILIYKPVEQLWAFGPLGLQLWNGIRAIDFLQSLPDVNGSKIGATGASGGATQTLMVQAVDDRIRFSAPANMVSFIMQGGSLCENAPNLRLDTNNVEIASIMAPRPMLMTSATGDWTRNMMNEEYPAVRAVYDLYGKADDVEAKLFEAPHNYNQPNREAMYAFFGKHVLGLDDASKLKERAIHPEPLQNALALFNRTEPEGALTFAQIFDEWMKLSQAQTADERERLRFALAAESPAKVLSRVDGERVVLSREGRGDRVVGIWIEGKTPAALVVNADGAEAARKSREVAALRREGRAMLMIDAFQTGSAVAPRRRNARNFLTFNKSDDANRVQDILTALAWLQQERNSPKPLLIGTGKAAVWCVFAAAVSETPVELRAGANGFHGTDQEFIDSFFVPGIQRAGGWQAALRLAGAAR